VLVNIDAVSTAHDLLLRLGELLLSLLVGLVSGGHWPPWSASSMTFSTGSRARSARLLASLRFHEPKSHVAGPLSRPVVAAPIAGASKLGHLDDAIARTELTLTEVDVDDSKCRTPCRGSPGCLMGQMPVTAVGSQVTPRSARRR
jgi:hypothetical protein